ncbi:MAG: hypothetical protein LC721_01780 [Actinobacteria bacterium]|nr:hypothetical protein [Actinomycetota bacterium]
MFRAAHHQLLVRRILLPGYSVLARLIEATHAEVCARLEKLLLVVEGRRYSELDLLRRPPFTPTIGGLVKALDRLTTIRALGAGELDLSAVPARRVAALARYALRRPGVGHWSGRGGGARKLGNSAFCSHQFSSLSCGSTCLSRYPASASRVVLASGSTVTSSAGSRYRLRPQVIDRSHFRRDPQLRGLPAHQGATSQRDSRVPHGGLDLAELGNHSTGIAFLRAVEVLARNQTICPSEHG